MDSLATQYGRKIENLFQEYAEFLGNEDDIQIELVFDREKGHYLFIEIGWQNGYRIYGTLIHIDLVEHKLWIQHDGTEDGVADELVTAGIPKDRIVLAFKLLEIRQYTEFAVS